MTSRQTVGQQHPVSPKGYRNHFISMLSAGIVGSRTDNRSGTEDTARRALYPEGDSDAADRHPWIQFHKPIIVMVIGGLLLGAGSLLALLHYTQVVNVSYTVGTVCLSIGLMFLVTGLVWLPVIQQKLQRKGLAHREHTRSTAG
ncbi:hypothetical protein AAFF_G00081290 [Aldrovandia affinis]|uniref:Uncharacterized protein n=1 Tax=Aldrovandia affinis TaxID=143900 RepID=A0AAD7WYA8_9TELE|nr:hypothetical protein AAFF_G00081290 [Aldrovandia affinis]